MDFKGDFTVLRYIEMEVGHFHLFQCVRQLDVLIPLDFLAVYHKANRFYVMAAIGIVLGVLIWKNRKTWSALNILCTLAIIVLILHVIEEWVLPGGLHYSYNINHGSEYLSRYPMNRLTDMITNFGAVVIGCIVLKVWGFRKPAGIAIMLFSAFEVIMHISIGIQDMKIFVNTE